MPVRKTVRKSDGAARRRKSVTARPAMTRANEMSGLVLPCKKYPVYRQIIWDIVAINDYLQEMRRRWAAIIGVTGPQWLILMAINDLDNGDGVPVGEVSAKIHAVSTFVTTQTKLLEKRGLLERIPSTADARVVLMSLSDRAKREISTFFTRWGDFHDYIFADFDDRALLEMTRRLGNIKLRTEVVRRRVADEF
jgi:DNA-binding MarR family transcriptional regulator